MGRIQGWQSNWKFRLGSVGNKCNRREDEPPNLTIKSTQIFICLLNYTGSGIPSGGRLINQQLSRDTSCCTLRGR